MAVYVAVASLYAVSIPPGKGADETAHIRYISWLAQHHSLPIFSRQNPGADYEFHQPPLYYLVSLPAYLLAPSSGDAAGQAVRFVNILIGLALLYLTFALGRSLAPDHPWAAVAAAAVVAFLPMHLGLVGTAGNDVLAEVLATAALLFIVRYLYRASAYRDGALKQPPRVVTIALVGLMVGLGMLTKSIAAVLVPVVWIAVALAGRGPRGYEWRRFLRDLAVGTATMLVLAGPWLWRNQSLYGDPLAQNAFLSAFQDRPSPQAMMSFQHLTPPLYVAQVVVWTMASVLGVFGPVYGNRFVFFPYWVYVVFGVKGIAEGVGFLRHLVIAKLGDWQRQAWLLSALLGLLLLVSFIRFNLSFFQAQARYLFPALPPAALAFCLGLEQLAPSRFRAVALWAGISLLFLLAVAGLFIWVAPQFRITPPPGAV